MSHLYRALDSNGATIDFLVSAEQDAVAAKRFLAKALGGENHPEPGVIISDKHAAYPPTIVRLKAEGAIEEGCQHRPVQYLNNVLEQDHRAIKRLVRASQHFHSFWGAWRTIAGYEAIHMIRKGQAYGSAKSVCCTSSFSVCFLRRTYKGRLESENMLPSSGNQLGDTWVVGETPWVWIWAPGAAKPDWIDQ